MREIKTWRWMPAALLFVLNSPLTSRAGDLAITSFDKGSNLVFQTSNSGTADHHYRVECATSLVSATWTPVRTASGVGASASVTNGVAATAGAAFYRVVATSNSAAFVDGPYMCIDVSGGVAATNYPSTYYSRLAEVPGGANSDAYKTTNLLMRLIPKGTFIMGSPTGEVGYFGGAPQHQVTLTQDFYIGVFEITQRQWELVMGNKPSYFSNAMYYATRPVERVSYYDIRENPLPVIKAWQKGTPITPNWPQSAQVHTNSFMGKLRAKTGLQGLDLPTESQWEYACRAGTVTALNSGRNLTNSEQDPQMAAVGRYFYNGPDTHPSIQIVNTNGGTAAVGTFPPNAWGLYDMHGNVWEWCLDWHDIYPGSVSDPLGATSGTARALRGGSWGNYADAARSATHSGYEPNYISAGYGFRIALPSD